MKPLFRNPNSIYLFCLLGSSICAYSQKNSYLNFSVADGLPSSEVYEAIQDKNGFIWFGTDNGVVKYDGGDFEVINSRQGLSDPVVFRLYEDQFGRIWFRTFTGKLSYYLDGKISKYIYNDSILHHIGKSIVSDLYYDSLDALWLTAGNKIIRINSSGEPTIEKTPRLTIGLRSLNPKKDLMTFNGPIHHIRNAQIDGQNFNILLTDTTQIFGSICTIHWMNNKYFSINNDLFVYEDGVKKVFTSHSPIISLSTDRENGLWIGSANGGAIRIGDPDFEKIFILKELVGKSVTKVLQDGEGGYWITTLEKGVFYFPNFSIKQFNLNPNSKLSSVNSVEGKIIITDFSGKITAYDNRGEKIVWEKSFEHPITTAYISNLNQIWVSTNAETLILNDDGQVLKRSLPPITIDFSAASSTIYGININGLYKFSLDGDLRSNHGLNSRFRNIHHTGTEIYMGGINGLFLYDSSLNYTREIKEFTDIKVANVLPLNDSLFLISTIGNGFILFDKKKNESLASYNSNSGFFANNIYTVLMVGSEIWMGTEKGIALTDKNSLLSGKPVFNFITKQSGLVNDKVNFLTSVEGVIWAFCDDGYSQIPLPQYRQVKQNPVAYIKEIKLNNSPIDYQSPLDFNHKQNNIQIKIGFLSFKNRNIFARFRLTPSEPWIISDNWIFSSSTLSPGRYTFQAEYSTDNLNWFPTGTNISFQIHPPWWETWYVRSISGAIFLLMGIVTYKKMIARYKEKTQYLALINGQQKKLLEAEIEATERERGRIAKDLHDSIGMDLVSIKLMANQLAKKTNDEGALEIQSQLQKTIAEIQNIIYGLAPSGLKLFGLSHGLENYISMVRKNHLITIILNFTGEEVKDEQTGAMVFRIIQELVTNSIKHSECNTISIYINASVTSISIDYNDNGLGFDLSNIRPGLGLSNIRSRVESLSGQINVESDFSGTNYSIKLPPSK